MSSKPVAEAQVAGGNHGSIAVRLTMWYALLSVVLVASAGSILYWVLADCLRRDDDQWLEGQIAEIRGVLSFHSYDMTVLREKLHRETVMLPGSYMRVLDRQGNKLVEAASANAETDFGFGDGPSNGGHDWTSRQGSMYRLMSSRVDAGVNDGFIIQVAIDRSAEEKILKSYQYILWGALSLSLAVAVVAGYLIARRSLQPVARLASIIDDLSAAHLYRRIADDAWPQELRPLAANFDQLLARLDESFARVSRFSADIAHELRTPLHILQGEAELALSKARSNEDYRDCIVSATEEYDRLARMVDALLFLARTEAPESLPNKTLLDLSHEATCVCAFYQALADEQETALLVSGTGKVAADSALLRRALGNLIINALRHTPSGGRITVNAQEHGDGSAVIVVADSGEGISSADLPYVFDRFYRADNARATHGTGTGLGLAIVKSIMLLHGGAVNLVSQPGRGTAATLSFPAPPPAQ